MPKNQGQWSNGSNRRTPTDKRTDTHATKRIIAPATRSIKLVKIGPVDPELALLNLQKKEIMEGKIYSWSASLGAKRAG